MKRNNVDKGRKLRKNQTDAEKKLWTLLRNRQLSGVKFRRQFSVDRYILDFYTPSPQSSSPMGEEVKQFKNHLTPLKKSVKGVNFRK